MGGGSLVQEGSLVGVCSGGHARMDDPAGMSCCWDGGRIVCVVHDISVVQFSGDRFGKAFMCEMGVLGAAVIPALRGGFIFSLRCYLR